MPLYRLQVRFDCESEESILQEASPLKLIFSVLKGAMLAYENSSAKIYLYSSLVS
jgi:hypothetical protein